MSVQKKKKRRHFKLDTTTLKYFTDLSRRVTYDHRAVIVVPRKMMEGRMFVGRRKGRPSLGWMDDVVADLKVVKIKQWMEKMKDRNGD